MLREAAKDLGRLRRITGIVGKYGYEGFVRRGAPSLSSADFKPASEEPVPPPSSPAERFRRMLEELGPTFIKFGQVLSSRPDLVAPAYVDELKKLQDDCEPLPFAKIVEVLTAAWQRPPLEVLERLDPEPLATASIAQVHRARTLDGHDVVVKVQRPGIAEEVQRDVDILYRLARLLDAVIEESQMAEPVGIVREFERGIAEELNFLNEAANIREFRTLHENRPDVVIPAVHDALSTSAVLTLEFLDGVPFSRLPPDANRPAIAQRIVEEALEEVFVDGVFHADPHPGNLLLLKDGRYGLLDFGLLGRLTPQMRETMVVLALGIALKDADSVARTIYRMGQPGQRVDIGEVRRDTQALFDRYLNRRLRDVDSQRMLQELLQLAMKHRIQIPAEYALLGRAGTTIEGMVREFDPDLEASSIVRPFAERLLMERVAPEGVQAGVYRALLQLQNLQQDVPVQLSQILSDMSGGRFGVSISGPELTRLNRSIVTAANTMAGAVLGGAFIIGSFIGLAQVEWSVRNVPIVGILGALGGTVVLVWLSAYALVRPRIRRFSVLRWLRGRRRGGPS